MFFTDDLGKEMVIIPNVISKHNVYPFAICNFRLAINKRYNYPFAIRNYLVCNF